MSRSNTTADDSSLSGSDQSRVSSRSNSSQSSISGPSTLSSDHACANSNPNKAHAQQNAPSTTASSFQHPRCGTSAIANLKTPLAQPIYEEPRALSETSGQYSITAAVGGNQSNLVNMTAQTSTQDLSLNHAMDSSESKRYHCSVSNCPYKKGFTRNSDLKRHVKDQHTDGQQWYCGCCDKTGTTSRKDHLRQHFRKVHKTNNYYSCTLDCCNGITAGFTFKVCFLEHIRRRHNGSLKYSQLHINEHFLDDDISQQLCSRCASTSLSDDELIRRNGEAHGVMGLSPVNSVSSLPSSNQESMAIGYNDCPPNTTSNDMPDLAPAFVGCMFPESPRQDMLLDPTLTIPYNEFTSIAPSNPVLQAPDCNEDFVMISDDIPTLEVEEINIQPIHFIVLRSAFVFIESAFKMVASIPFCIAYNPFRGKIRIQGSSIEVQKAKFEIEYKIANYTMETAAEYLRGSGHALEAALGRMSLSRAGDVSVKAITQKGENIYPIRVQEDRNLIQVWNEYILPELPEILEPAVGKEYSACFVREGWNEDQARPCIQIQSPHRPSELNRRNIEATLVAISGKHMLNHIRIQFLKGKFKPLISDTRESDSPLPSINDEDEDDVYDFPHLKRFWFTPGMAAGVGLMGDREVCASIGGHILVDGYPFTLLVDHFIERSLRQTSRTLVPRDLRVTSPPLADVDYVRECLNRTLRDYQAEIYRSGDNYTSMSQLVNMSLEQHRLTRELVFLHMALLSEVDKQDESFILGEIVHRSGVRARPFSGSPYVPVNLNPYGNMIRMDYSLCKSNRHRMGANRYRYPYCLQSKKVDYYSDSQLGAEPSCTETCDIEPNADVHYLGRQIGLRQGQINGARMYCSAEHPVTHDQLVTQEWFVVPKPDEPITQDSCAGESGSFILRTGDRRVMAQLFGYDIGKLLVTPIHDIFEDIKLAFRAQHVSLAGDPLPPSANLASPQEICEVRKRQEPKRFNLHSLPLVAPALVSQLPMIGGPPLRNASPLASLKGSIRPVSPVPSLVSSGSLSQDSEKIPLSPEDIRHHSRNTSGSVLLPNPAILDAADHQTQPFYEEPNSLTTSPSKQCDKASIHYILHVKENRSSPLPLKSSTFPKLDISFKRRTFSLDGCAEEPEETHRPTVVV